jgi:hypothetical protein
VAVADQRARVLGEVVTHAGDDVLGRLGPGQVEPLLVRRPLREVDVVVPQPRDQPSPVRVVLLDPEWTLQCMPDVLDHPLLDHQVDGPGPARPEPELHDPGVAEDEVGHAHTVVAPARIVPDVVVAFGCGNEPDRRGPSGSGGLGSRNGVAEAE